MTTSMFLGAGEVIGPVVNGEPAPADTTAIKLDHFRHPATQTGFHEAAELGYVLGE